MDFLSGSGVDSRVLYFSTRPEHISLGILLKANTFFFIYFQHWSP